MASQGTGTVPIVSAHFRSLQRSACVRSGAEDEDATSANKTGISSSAVHRTNLLDTGRRRQTRREMNRLRVNQPSPRMYRLARKNQTE